MRRKTLVNALQAAGRDADMVRQALAACGLAPQVRAEAIDLAGWAQLARLLGAASPPKETV